MTSQNSIVRWAASIPYSTAGPNIPNVSDENCVCGTGVCSLLILNLHLWGSAPAHGHGNVTRQPAGEVDNLYSQLVAALPKILVPELIDFLRRAGERFFPARLLLIDRAAFVRAQLVGKANDLNLGHPILDRPVDDLQPAPDRFLVGSARCFTQLIDEGLFLGLCRRLRLRLLFGLFRLSKRNLLPHLIRRRHQCVGVVCHALLHTSADRGLPHTLSRAGTSLRFSFASALEVGSATRNQATYNAGRKIRVRTVATASPPIIANAIGPKTTVGAIGIMTSEGAEAVSKMGRGRWIAAVTTASHTSSPASIGLPTSSMRMTELRAIMPTSASTPRIATKPSGFCASSNAPTTPIRPSGATLSTSNTR